MGIIAWIIVGGLAGWIASALLHERSGCLMNIIVGVIGAFIGGIVMNVIGGVGVTGLNLWSVIVAVLGAIILLAILRAIRGPSPPADL